MVAWTVHVQPEKWVYIDLVESSFIIWNDARDSPRASQSRSTVLVSDGNGNQRGLTTTLPEIYVFGGATREGLTLEFFKNLSHSLNCMDNHLSGVFDVHRHIFEVLIAPSALMEAETSVRRVASSMYCLTTCFMSAAAMVGAACMMFTSSGGGSS
ncbi:hypothetical protein PROFUN_10860 [Planoprotostelium fungivorum]|uniref:Uncharacterized protein n=1 Tax=Planoprotostelium fungivorum TaxID=1890364 RepID=A0A2P6NCT9_9EUKA|nr:hypothetical protein PROFUN_10860 [Planoprotostelium fungivorum]